MGKNNNNDNNSNNNNSSNTNNNVQHETMPVSLRLRLISLVAILDILGASIIVPLLSHQARSLGATTQQVGLIGSVYGILQLVGSPIVGKMSDVFGRRTILLLSLIFTGFSYLIQGMASSLWMLVFSRIPVGIMKQSMSVSQALISDLTTKQDRLDALARNNAAIAFGFIIGPAIGGYLGKYGYFAPACLAAAVFFVNAILIHLSFPSNLDEFKKRDANAPAIETQKKKGKNEEAEESILSFKMWKDAFYLHRDAQKLLMVRLISTTCNQMLRSNFALVTSTMFAMNTSQHGMVLSFMGFVGFFVQQFAVPKLGKNFGSDSTLIIAASMMTGIAQAAVVSVGNVYLFFFLLIPLAFSTGVARTATISIISKTCDEGTIGLMMGLSGSADSVSRIVSPALGAFLIDRYGVFAIGVATLILMTPIPVLLFSLSSGHAVQLEELAKKKKK